MNNQPIYKTAAELGIEQWEHDGLAALVGPLSMNKKWVDMRKANKWCGTVACIGGHLALSSGFSRFGDDVVNYVNLRRDQPGLGRLFFPTRSRKKKPHPAWFCSAPQAARAVVNFLVTGEPQWDAVMGDARAETTP